jgi:predicted amidophosphoribosyltransferase
MASHYCLSCGAQVESERYLCDTCEASLLENLCEAQRFYINGEAD